MGKRNFAKFLESVFQEDFNGVATNPSKIDKVRADFRLLVEKQKRVLKVLKKELEKTKGQTLREELFSYTESLEDKLESCEDVISVGFSRSLRRHKLRKKKLKEKEKENK